MRGWFRGRGSACEAPRGAWPQAMVFSAVFGGIILAYYKFAVGNARGRNGLVIINEPWGLSQLRVEFFLAMNGMAVWIGSANPGGLKR